MRNILGVGRVPFHDIFIFAVPVHIAHTHVIGAVGIRLPCGSHTVGRLLQRNLQIGGFPGPDFGADLLFLLPIHNCRYRIHRTGTALPVQIVGAAGNLGNLRSVPVQAEIRPRHAARGGTGYFIAQQPPADEYSFRSADCRQPPVQLLHLHTHCHPPALLIIYTHVSSVEYPHAPLPAMGHF
ncbi:hypothetical protein D3C75_912450 [compost metagenome]